MRLGYHKFSRLSTHILIKTIDTSPNKFTKMSLSFKWLLILSTQLAWVQTRIESKIHFIVQEQQLGYLEFILHVQYEIGVSQLFRIYSNFCDNSQIFRIQINFPIFQTLYFAQIKIILIKNSDLVRTICLDYKIEKGWEKAQMNLSCHDSRQFSNKS